MEKLPWCCWASKELGRTHYRSWVLGDVRIHYNILINLQLVSFKHQNSSDAWWFYYTFKWANGSFSRLKSSAEMIMENIMKMKFLYIWSCRSSNWNNTGWTNGKWNFLIHTALCKIFTAQNYNDFLLTKKMLIKSCIIVFFAPLTFLSLSPLILSPFSNCSSEAMSNNWLRIGYCHSRVFGNVSFNISTRDVLIIRVVIGIGWGFLVNWLLV